MANWIYHIVSFQGEAEQLAALKDLFSSLHDLEHFPLHGQLPHFIDGHRGHFYNVEIEEDNIRYETLWAPNLPELQKIADYFKLSFELFYYNMENTLYGEAVYQNGALEDYALDREDFAKVVMDETTETFPFEGKSYECDHEVYEILLERKKQGL